MSTVPVPLSLSLSLSLYFVVCFVLTHPCILSLSLSLSLSLFLSFSLSLSLSLRISAAEIENLDRLFQLVLDQAALNDPGMLSTVVCIASDHGEMLGDHGDVDKSKPWEGSAHVPLICMGPGIQAGATVTSPVATLDMGGTFLDFAGTKPAPGMSTQSFRGLLEGKGTSESTGYRSFVSSGLSNFRLVVWEDPTTQTQWKYICCLGECPFAPSTAPQPKQKGGYVEMLIDIVKDPYDMHDQAPKEREVVKKLQTLLPPAYAAGCTALSNA